MNMATKPRRPAQLLETQIESIEGGADTAEISNLAHACAQALLPMGTHFIEYDETVRQRIIELTKKEGVDTIAELWVSSPEDTLPGIMWRGFLIKEWIRREKQTVELRYNASLKYEKNLTLLKDKNIESEKEKTINTFLTPKQLHKHWNDVFKVQFDKHFDELLFSTSVFCYQLSKITPVWIEDDSDTLATYVTRRDKAL